MIYVVCFFGVGWRVGKTHNTASEEEIVNSPKPLVQKEFKFLCGCCVHDGRD